MSADISADLFNKNGTVFKKPSHILNNPEKDPKQAIIDAIEG